MKKVTMNLPEVKDYRLTEGLNQLKTNLAFCGKDIKVITCRPHAARLHLY